MPEVFTRFDLASAVNRSAPGRTPARDGPPHTAGDCSSDRNDLYNIDTQDP